MTDLHTENARLRAALGALVAIVEGIDGAMNHGTWRDDKGMRLKDTPQWVTLYVSLATPAPDAVQEAAVDIAAIENGGKRWHGEDHRVVAVRWEPYKPDGQRQMKAKGRWQEQVGSGDYWRWQNCDRPAALRAIAGDRTPEENQTKNGD
jgi:hypothetical protein